MLLAQLLSHINLIWPGRVFCRNKELTEAAQWPNASGKT